MKNKKLRLNANTTYLIIIGTSRQRSKRNCFFPTPILNHSIIPSDIVRNLGLIAILISDNIFLRHVAAASIIFVTFAVFVAIFPIQLPKPLLQHSLQLDLFTASLFFITIFYNFSAFKTLHWLPIQSHIIFNLCSVACHPFFWTTIISIYHALSRTESRKALFIWFSIVVCSLG